MKTIDASNESLTDLMELCLGWNKDKICAYRGQSDYVYGLTPGIYRALLETLDPPFKAEEDYQWLGELERDIYRGFIDRGRTINLADKINDEWENLFYGQHHGLPTRLLDWSTEFVAAIYFAVCDCPDKDGALWLVNVTDFPHPTIVGRLSKTNGAFRIKAVRSCIDSDSLVFFVPQSRPWVSGGTTGHVGPSAFPSDQARDSTRSGFLTFLASPYIDERIRNQKGIFSIYLTDDPKDIVFDHANYIEQLEKIYGIDLLTKIRIPASRKASIKSDLKRTGKDPFSIYPDLTGLISLLKDERASTIEYYQNERKKWAK